MATSDRKTLARRGLRPFPWAAPMRHCIYPGTFDPITSGHLDVLSRAARLFDRVTVAVADNAAKEPLFAADERVAMILPNVARFPNVSVTTSGSGSVVYQSLITLDSGASLAIPNSTFANAVSLTTGSSIAVNSARAAASCDCSSARLAGLGTGKSRSPCFTPDSADESR